MTVPMRLQRPNPIGRFMLGPSFLLQASSLSAFQPTLWAPSPLMHSRCAAVIRAACASRELPGCVLSRALRARSGSESEQGLFRLLWARLLDAFVHGDCESLAVALATQPSYAMRS